MSRIGNATRAFFNEMVRAERQIATKADVGGQANAGWAGWPSAGSLPPQIENAISLAGMQNQNPFSPGRPIQQFMPEGTLPRSWEFPAGYNVTTRPRSGQNRVSFETLKNIVMTWDVARLCIEHLQDDIRSFEFEILPADGVTEDVSEQCKIGRKFLEMPDGINPLDAWQSMLLEDVLRYDAGSIFKERKRDGTLGALHVLSGVTLAPLTDYWGRPPAPPAPAYVQYINGVPWTWLTVDDLTYQPFRPLPESFFGLPPIEWLLLTANTDLRFQWHFLQYFTEGSIPDHFMEAPPDASEPEEIIKFQQAWDTVMEGDQSQKHKIRWVPSGAKPVPAGNKNFDPTFPLYLMRKTCAAFKVVPADIGITDTVNKASSETQVDVQFRTGTSPRLNYLQGIYTRILQKELKLPCKFQFDVGREKKDRLQEAQAMDAYVKMGALSPDEVRLDVLGRPVDTANPTPRFIFSPRSGAIPLKSIREIAGDIDPLTADVEADTVEKLESGDVRTEITPTGTTPQPTDIAGVKQKQANDAAKAQQQQAKVAGQQKEQAATGVGAAPTQRDLQRMVEDILAPDFARLEASNRALEQAREQLRDKRLVSAIARQQRPVEMHFPKDMVRAEVHVEQPTPEVHIHHTAEIDARTTVERTQVDVHNDVPVPRVENTVNVPAPKVEVKNDISVPPAKSARKSVVRKGPDGELIIERED